MRRRGALGKYDTAIELPGKVYDLASIDRFTESGIDNHRFVPAQGGSGHVQHCMVGDPMRLLTVQVSLKSGLG